MELGLLLNQLRVLANDKDLQNEMAHSENTDAKVQFTPQQDNASPVLISLKNQKDLNLQDQTRYFLSILKSFIEQSGSKELQLWFANLSQKFPEFLTPGNDVLFAKEPQAYLQNSKLEIQGLSQEFKNLSLILNQLQSKNSQNVDFKNILDQFEKLNPILQIESIKGQLSNQAIQLTHAIEKEDWQEMGRILEEHKLTSQAVQSYKGTFKSEVNVWSFLYEKLDQISALRSEEFQLPLQKVQSLKEQIQKTPRINDLQIPPSLLLDKNKSFESLNSRDFVWISNDDSGLQIFDLKSQKKITLNSEQQHFFKNSVVENQLFQWQNLNDPDGFKEGQVPPRQLQVVLRPVDLDFQNQNRTSLILSSPLLNKENLSSGAFDFFNSIQSSLPKIDNTLLLNDLTQASLQAQLQKWNISPSNIPSLWMKVLQTGQVEESLKWAQFQELNEGKSQNPSLKLGLKPELEELLKQIVQEKHSSHKVFTLNELQKLIEDKIQEPIGTHIDKSLLSQLKEHFDLKTMVEQNDKQADKKSQEVYSFYQGQFLKGEFKVVDDRKNQEGNSSANRERSSFVLKTSAQSFGDVEVRYLAQKDRVQISLINDEAQYQEEFYSEKESLTQDLKEIDLTLDQFLYFPKLKVSGGEGAQHLQSSQNQSSRLDLRI